MTSIAPLSFHPLPERVRHVVIYNDNKCAKLADGYRHEIFGVDEYSFVYSSRPVEIGETVYLCFGPKMAHLSYTVGFYVNVGLTNRNPDTLPCTVTSGSLPGFWVSKIYTCNDATLRFTLDPSGIVDFHGPMIGSHTMKSLDLGELTSFYWVVVSIPEQPFYVEFAPPPPDAKPVARKHSAPKKLQSNENSDVPESSMQNISVPLSSPPNVTVPEISKPSDNVTESSTQSITPVISPPSNTVEEISKPRDNVPESSSPIFSPEISPPSDAIEEISKPSNNVQKGSSTAITPEISLPSGTTNEILEPCDAVSESSPLNVNAKKKSPPNDNIPEVWKPSATIPEISPLRGNVLTSLPPSDAVRRNWLPSSAVPVNSPPPDSIAKGSQQSITVPKSSLPSDLTPKNPYLSNIFSESSSPSAIVPNNSSANNYVSLKSPPSTTVPVNSSESKSVPISSSPNGVTLTPPQTNRVPVTLLHRSSVPVSSSTSAIIAVTSKQNGAIHASPSQNGSDSVHTAQGPEHHTEITIIQDESDHQDVEGESLLREAVALEDRRTITRRRYCIIFGVVSIIVLIALLITYFKFRHQFD